jgi:hypothetical protein
MRVPLQADKVRSDTYLQPPDTEQPQARIMAATTSHDNVVALLGSSDNSAGLAPLQTFLRATLLTLKAEKPAETHATAEEFLNAGGNVALQLEAIEALVGHPARALINKRVMTEEDSRVAGATPCEVEKRGG